MSFQPFSFSIKRIEILARRFAQSSKTLFIDFIGSIKQYKFALHLSFYGIILIESILKSYQIDILKNKTVRTIFLF
jgi:hypothetical protein